MFLSHSHMRHRQPQSRAFVRPRTEIRLKHYFPPQRDRAEVTTSIALEPAEAPDNLTISNETVPDPAKKNGSLTQPKRGSLD